MDTLIVAAAFLGVYLLCLYGTFWLKQRFLPPAIVGSRLLQRGIGFVLLFVGIFFLMEWGHEPLIRQGGGAGPVNVGFSNPFRWTWWAFGAVTLGIGEGFISGTRRREWRDPLEARSERKIRVDEPV